MTGSKTKENNDATHSAQEFGESVRFGGRQILRASPYFFGDSAGRVCHGHGSVWGWQIYAAEHSWNARRSVVWRIFFSRTTSAQTQRQTAERTAQVQHRIRLSELSPDRQPHGIRKSGNTAVVQEYSAQRAVKPGLRRTGSLQHCRQERPVP